MPSEQGCREALRPQSECNRTDQYAEGHYQIVRLLRLGFLQPTRELARQANGLLPQLRRR